MVIQDYMLYSTCFLYETLTKVTNSIDLNFKCLLYDANLNVITHLLYPCGHCIYQCDYYGFGNLVLLSFLLFEHLLHFPLKWHQIELLDHFD